LHALYISSKEPKHFATSLQNEFGKEKNNLPPIINFILKTRKVKVL
jgi:hypothetical protein